MSWLGEWICSGEPQQYAASNLLNADPTSIWNAGKYAPASVVFELARPPAAFAIQHDILNEFGGDSADLAMELHLFSDISRPPPPSFLPRTRCRDYGWTVIVPAAPTRHRNLRLDFLSSSPRTWIALRRAVALFSDDDLERFLRAEPSSAVVSAGAADEQKLKKD